MDWAKSKWVTTKLVTGDVSHVYVKDNIVYESRHKKGNKLFELWVWWGYVPLASRCYDSVAKLKDGLTEWCSENKELIESLPVPPTPHITETIKNWDWSEGYGHNFGPLRAEVKLDWNSHHIISWYCWWGNIEMASGTADSIEGAKVAAEDWYKWDFCPNPLNLYVTDSSRYQGGELLLIPLINKLTRLGLLSNGKDLGNYAT